MSGLFELASSWPTLINWRDYNPELALCQSSARSHAGLRTCREEIRVSGKRGGQEDLGANFRAEGKFGYEPDVLVELRTERAEGTKRGSHLVHYGIVLKDRSSKVKRLEFFRKDRSGYRNE